MSMPAAKPRYTIRDYLQREREAIDKHEYRDGEILLMDGGTEKHSLITMNVGGELRNRLKGKPCRAYDSNLRIRIPRTILYTYPDVTVICGPSQHDPNDPSGETVTNAKLIIEVLSPSTEAYDRGEKFARYQQLDSLEQYVLVSQSTARVEVFSRRPQGAWLLQFYSGLDSAAVLSAIDVTLPLNEIYSGIEFPLPPETRQENPNPT